MGQTIKVLESGMGIVSVQKLRFLGGNLKSFTRITYQFCEIYISATTDVLLVRHVINAERRKNNPPVLATTLFNNVGN